jgi:hypothetical protein
MNDLIYQILIEGKTYDCNFDSNNIFIVRTERDLWTPISKDYIITLAEWREQQINSILE